MTKKQYSFNLDKEEMDKLDKLLLSTKMNRTDFIQGAINQYNRLMYEKMDTSKPQLCDKCGSLYKGVINCPKCIDIIKSPI